MSLTTNTSTPAGAKLCGTCGAVLEALTRTIARSGGDASGGDEDGEPVVKIVGYICPNDPSHMP